MSDQRICNLADILVNYSGQIKPQDRVMIISYPVAEPLVCEIYRTLLEAGAYPHVYFELEELDYLRFTAAKEDQLRFVNPVAKLVAETFDAYIQIQSETNTHTLTNADPERQMIHEKAYGVVRKIIRDRTAAGDLRWVLTVFPTQAYAQNAEMSLREYRDYVFRTTYADLDDPIQKWRSIEQQQQSWVDWLKGKKHVQLKGSHIDLTFSIEGRPFINDAGRYNLPDGEIFTGPEEDSVNGWIRFSYPAIFRGREVEGIELSFEDGKVVKATARRNESFLHTILEIDQGARYLGEFGIGTNREIDRYIKNMLFDEKMSGTIHVALGAGFPESGSKNNSAIHWDLVCEMRDGGQIIVDGELIYESGEFKI